QRGGRGLELSRLGPGESGRDREARLGAGRERCAGDEDGDEGEREALAQWGADVVRGDVGHTEPPTRWRVSMIRRPRWTPGLLVTLGAPPPVGPARPRPFRHARPPPPRPRRRARARSRAGSSRRRPPGGS